VDEKISRRKLLKGAAAAGVGALIPSGTAQAGRVTSPPGEGSAPSSDRILPLTSTSDVYTPPRGRSFMKFSFDFPEPSVEFQGLRFSFRLYTFENTYGLDRTRGRAVWWKT
jgi:hypothetical protein